MEAIPGSGYEPGLMHRMVERLTGLKLRLGRLRRRAEHEPIPGRELVTELHAMETELDTATHLVQTLQAEMASSTSPAAASNGP